MLKTEELAGGRKLPTGSGARYLLNPMSRVVHGNAAGYENNTLPTRDLREMQRISASSMRLRPDPRVQELDRDGFVQFRPKFPEDLLRTIAKRAQAFFEDPGGHVEMGRHAVKASHIVPDPVLKVPEIRDLLTPEITNIVESHYRAHFAVDMVRLWRNYPVPPQAVAADHYSNLWHNDYDIVTRLRFHVLLSDGVTPKTGAMGIHLIPQTKRILRSGYVRRDAVYGRARALLDDPNLVRYFQGNRGEACFFNPQLCLHKAGLPREGTHRDLVQFTLIPSPRPLSPEWPSTLKDDPEIKM